MSKCFTDTNGNKIWRKDNGAVHREDGPAVEYFNGTKYWYLNNKCHRKDGPAIEYKDGDKEWLLNGKRHREDGPAIEYVNGYKEWFYKGKHIKCKSLEEFLRIIKMEAFF